MRISDWSSDVCSSDLAAALVGCGEGRLRLADRRGAGKADRPCLARQCPRTGQCAAARRGPARRRPDRACRPAHHRRAAARSEEHTSELQSLMRISYAVFCLKTKNTKALRKITQLYNIT